jgi:hypothetical protein
MVSSTAAMRVAAPVRSFGLLLLGWVVRIVRSVQENAAEFHDLHFAVLVVDHTPNRFSPQSLRNSPSLLRHRRRRDPTEDDL